MDPYLTPARTILAIAALGLLLSSCVLEPFVDCNPAVFRLPLQLTVFYKTEPEGGVISVDGIKLSKEPDPNGGFQTYCRYSFNYPIDTMELIPGQPVKPGEDGMCDRRPARFINSWNRQIELGRYEVRWPDGTTRVETPVITLCSDRCCKRDFVKGYVFRKR